METKVCTKCSESKSITKFGKTGINNQYVSNICRSCAHQKKMKNPKSRMSKILYDAKRRCTDPKCHGYERYGGRGIEYHINKEDFYKKFYRVVEKFIANGDIPSIDRIDTNGHYTIDNVQITHWEANKAESRQRMSKKFKKYRERPIRTCRICKRDLPKDSFITGKVHEDGTVSKYTECRECWIEICHDRGYGERTKKPGTLDRWKKELGI